MKLRALSSLSSLGLLEEAIFSFPILQGALFSTSHFFPFLFSLCLLKICTRTWEMKSIEWKMTSIYFSRAASQWSLIYTGINSSRQIIDEPVINVNVKKKFYRDYGHVNYKYFSSWESYLLATQGERNWYVSEIYCVYIVIIKSTITMCSD